jgi:hypothetical protein
MILTVRSSDPGSAVLVRFETDDTSASPSKPFGILAILPELGKFDPGRHDYPYGQNSTLAAVQVTCGERYTTSGTSNTITIDLAEECAPFECYRVISIRTIGAVVVEEIRLTSLSLIPGL